MPITHLVTHNGGFHADELLSSVILTRLYPEAQLMRSRDAAWITPGEGRLIYDVGRAYDAEAGIFDHHQRPNPLREDGQPYSSFGLIWHHFGRAYLAAMDVPAEDIDEIHRGVDLGFVLPVDLVDNGAIEPSVAGPLAGLTLPVLLETLKPVFDDRGEGADDAAFLAALPVARAFVEAAVRGRAAKRRAESVVRRAIEAAGASPILELPMGMPFRPTVEKMGADHLLFVLGLILIVRSRWMLVKTITAFTVAHSITLAAATFKLISVPTAPLEAAIALSILFLGPEIVRVWRGQTSFTIRHPWVVAFGFGLLHGVGFASALAQVGLPRSEIPLALLCFNLGVEVAQLAFVLIVIPIGHAFRALPIDWLQRLQRVPGYVVGTLGAYWTVAAIAAMTIY